MSKLLTILTDPDPVLRKKSAEVAPETLSSRQFREHCDNMILTMTKRDGVGLAAPQIGKNIRVIVINTKDGPKCFINPRLTKKSWFKEWGDEGCLSIPNTFGQVQRHKKIKCSSLDPAGKKMIIEASGLMARILQHEIDHLDGILFIDKAKNIKRLEN